MYREFSWEVLLSLIELCQFKEYLKEYAERDSNPFEFPRSSFKTIHFYDDMPRSTIVFRENTIRMTDIFEVRSETVGKEEITGSSPDTDAGSPEDEKEMMVGEMDKVAGELYFKYIRRGSPLEINISH